MDLDKLKKLFDDLLSEWWTLSHIVSNDRGSTDDQKIIDEDEKEYRSRFKEAIGE